MEEINIRKLTLRVSVKEKIKATTFMAIIEIGSTTPFWLLKK